MCPTHTHTHKHKHNILLSLGRMRGKQIRPRMAVESGSGEGHTAIHLRGSMCSSASGYERFVTMADRTQSWRAAPEHRLPQSLCLHLRKQVRARAFKICACIPLYQTPAPLFVHGSLHTDLSLQAFLVLIFYPFRLSRCGQCTGAWMHVKWGWTMI